MHIETVLESCWIVIPTIGQDNSNYQYYWGREEFLKLASSIGTEVANPQQTGVRIYPVHSKEYTVELSFDLFLYRSHAGPWSPWAAHYTFSSSDLSSLPQTLPVITSDL